MEEGIDSHSGKVSTGYEKDVRPAITRTPAQDPFIISHCTKSTVVFLCSKRKEFYGERNYFY